MLDLKPISGRHEGLTTADYCRASKAIGCAVSAVRAIDAVESAGRGFLPSGKPKILFEGHIFHKLTGGKYDQVIPTVSYPHWTKAHYIGGDGEYARLEAAIAHNETAALMSASWGRYQIMGENFRACGYTSVQAFVADMFRGEDKQLSAFITYVKNDHIAPYLIHKNWPKVAELYNGPAYHRNLYDVKLQTADHKFAGVKFSCQEEASNIAPTPIDAALPVVCHDECVSHNNTSLDSRYLVSPTESPSEDSDKQNSHSNPPETTTEPTTNSAPDPTANASESPDKDDDSTSSSVSVLNRLKGKLSAAWGKTSGTLDKVDTVQSNVDRVNNATNLVRSDSVKSLWTIISHHILQLVTGLVSFLVGIPPRYWIILAISITVISGLYLYRQTLLGSIREKKEAAPSPEPAV